MFAVQACLWRSMHLQNCAHGGVEQGTQPLVAEGRDGPSLPGFCCKMPWLTAALNTITASLLVGLGRMCRHCSGVHAMHAATSLSFTSHVVSPVQVPLVLQKPSPLQATTFTLTAATVILFCPCCVAPAGAARVLGLQQPSSLQQQPPSLQILF
eukprot:GHRQ01017918.1.p1 GENE.GHRQ01017918.1~~GHRQ01017918.1.p1  ORF type:complete len:154 (-),score=20.23 GHRQ01017918.1:195-656(-)